MEKVRHLFTTVKCQVRCVQRRVCVCVCVVSRVNIVALDNTLGFRIGSYRGELLVVGSMSHSIASH